MAVKSNEYPDETGCLHMMYDDAGAKYTILQSPEGMPVYLSKREVRRLAKDLLAVADIK